MISKLRIEDHLRQYRNLQVPHQFNSKIEFIVNGIQLPHHAFSKTFDMPLQVLYVGRGTEEKRVYLVAEIAKLAAHKNLPVQFIFMGDVVQAIPADTMHIVNY